MARRAVDRKEDQHGSEVEPLTPLPAAILKSLLFPIVAILASVAFVGCKSKPKVLPPGGLTPEQITKLETNATKAYEQIIKDYPNSPHADEAKQRLQALQSTKK